MNGVSNLSNKKLWANRSRQIIECFKETFKTLPKCCFKFENQWFSLWSENNLGSVQQNFMNVCLCLILGSTPWLQFIALFIWSRIQFVTLDHQRSTCSLYHAPQLLCSRILFVSLDHWMSTCSLHHAPQLLCSRILFVSDNFQFPLGRRFEPATFGSKCRCHTNCATEVVVQVSSRVTLILKITDNECGGMAQQWWQG